MKINSLTLSPTLSVWRKLVAKYSTTSSFSSKTAMWMLERPDIVQKKKKSFHESYSLKKFYVIEELSRQARA